MASFDGQRHEYRHTEPVVEIVELGVLPVDDDYLVIASQDHPTQWVEGHAIDLLEHR